MKEPNILLKAANFTVAAIGHMLRGNPTCDQKEIDYRFSICQKCDHFTGIACADKRCGCNINDQIIYLNKLAWADQSCPQDKWGTPLKSLVTFCVTTFKRPDALARLLGSIQQFYPDVRVVTVDTKGNLSWGRNYAVKQVTTPYLMILEDDFVFTEETNVRLLLHILQEDKELGMIGGAVNESYTAYNFDEFRFTLGQVPANVVRCNKFGQEYAVCDYTDNFGLFRKEVFTDYQWDEDLEIHEHINFFYSLSKSRKWRVGVAKNVRVKHERPRPSPEYKQFRKRDFVKKAEQKLGLSFIGSKGAFEWPSTYHSNLMYREELVGNVSPVESDS